MLLKAYLVSKIYGARNDLEDTMFVVLHYFGYVSIGISHTAAITHLCKQRTHIAKSDLVS
jgi:hypothetical protein